LVFIDGRFNAKLSRIGSLPSGVRIESLADAAANDDPVVCEHLGRYAKIEAEAFDALNSAFIEDGAFVHIAQGASLEAPIHFQFVCTGSEPSAIHPRNLFVAERNARATIVENYVTLREDAACFSNAVTEIVVAQDAGVQHYVLERESECAFNISTLRVQQAARSSFESHTALLGGRLVRNNVHVELTGEKADSLINGLYMPHNRQHHDNHMRVIHAAEGCDSRQFYKGVLNDYATAVFTGRIVVTPQGQKTDAKQSNRNLLLSPTASANTKPQLEIYADDVKCTHGATTGQIDENAMHYLRSRGIDRETARGMLVYAFAHESLDRMTIAPIRQALERAMLARLPQSVKLTKLVG
jgi:Fe-S cluster assembly protein SufD